MNAALLVFFGAGIGGVLRHGINLLSAHWFGGGFPVGTAFINVAGSVIIGVLVGWLAFHATEDWSSSVRFFAVTGVLGGFTTFSSFSLETMLLVERGDTGLAMLYVALSVALSLAGAAGGLAAVRALA